MTREKQKQNLRTVEQIIDDMNLFDDDLMSMVFDGNIEATELLLKIILKQDDIQVESVVGSSREGHPFRYLGAGRYRKTLQRRGTAETGRGAHQTSPVP